jgi:RecJ-like exonuclease
MSDVTGKGNPNAFVKCVSKAAKLLLKIAKEGGWVSITSHLDADGITSAGIVGKMLCRLDVPFMIRVVKQLEEDVLNEALEESADLHVFTDLGSSYLNLFSKDLREKFMLIDHHQPMGDEPNNLLHVNPSKFGFDGVNEISGSGVAFFIAKEVNEVNRDLSPLAIVGALGDVQDKNDERKLVGLNEAIVKEAMSAHHVQVSTDLVFYGRETKPIFQAMSQTSDVFVPGLSGEDDKCLGFLTNLGIKIREGDRWRTVSDLTFEEKRKIASSIVKYLLSREFSPTVALTILGTVYTLPKEDKGSPLRDCREFSSLLNACGRMDKPDLGVAVCMGDRGNALEEALHVLVEYRKLLATALEALLNNPEKIEEKKRFYLIKGEDVANDRTIGTISSILSNLNVLKKDKPIIAIAPSDDGTLKVSARAGTSLVQKGLNLGRVLREAASSVSGIGGGHDVAAGAKIPAEREEKFLTSIHKLLRSSMV